MRTATKYVSLLSLAVLVHASGTEKTLRRNRNVVTIDVEAHQSVSEHRDLGSKAAKSAKSAKASKSGKSAKNAKASKSAKSAKNAKKPDESKKTKIHGMDDLMNEIWIEAANSMSMLDLSMSMGMDMSMPSSPTMVPVPVPTTVPVPVPTTVPVPVPTAVPGPVPSTAPAVPTMAPVETMAPPAVMTSAPTSQQDACSNVTREDALLTELLEVTDMTLLTDVAAPQGQAFSWLVEGDPAQVDPCTYPSLAQRYGLATLYFASGGPSWTNTGGWLSEMNECSWYGVVCDSMGMVTDVDLCKCFSSKISFPWSFLPGTILMFSLCDMCSCQ